MLVCGAVLVSGYLLLHEDTHATAVAAMERAVAPLVAVDAASWPLVESFGVSRFFEATARATVVLANEREARTLTGLEDEGAARALGERFPVAAVKLGARGAVAVVDGALHRVPGESIQEVDPTGAGDAFDGVLLGALARGAARGGGARPGGARRRVRGLQRPGLARGGDPVTAFRVGEEVVAARAAGTAAVALETSVIGQGLPHPRNLECIERMSAAIARDGRRAGVGRRRRRSGGGGTRRRRARALRGARRRDEGGATRPPDRRGARGSWAPPR